MRDGTIELAVPSFMDDVQIIQSARSLVAKIKKQQEHNSKNLSDSELYERALHLARVWLGSELEPSSVVWSDQQTTLWGSCTPSTGRIRISTMLRGMPQWVIDGVLVHELSHLKYSDHGDDFKDFAAQYPKIAQADAFLDGVSFAQHRLGQEAPTHD